MSSSIVEAATQIAREFEYPAEQVQAGVKEYIREMDEGLAKEHTTLSQIPTFVTNVPNGTEKVRDSRIEPTCCITVGRPFLSN